MISTCKVEVGEAIFEAVIYGVGDTVVLLPGGGCSSRYFDTFARGLAEAGFRAVAVNPRGIGGSTGPLEGITLHDLAADIAGVIAALDGAPAHVLGLAFGNRVARCLATDRPALVRSVILLAAGGLVAPDLESEAAVQQMFRQDLTEPERLEIMKVVYLSPAADPRVLLQLEQWPGVAAAQIAASRATPLEAWWEGGPARATKGGRWEPASDMPTDVTFRCAAETYVLVMFGRLAMEAALRDGRLSFDGDPDLVAVFGRSFVGG
jgi:pimeloyl-ACP methyl ester carboxylesterase